MVSNFALIIIQFLITVIIEFFIVLIFIRKDWKIIAGYIFLINLFTWPLANFVLGFYYNLFVIEIFVFLIEIFLIKILFRLSYPKSVIISLVANLVSFILGYILIMFL